MTSRYGEVYESWRKNPEGFWMDQAAAIDWFTKPETAFDPDLGVYGGWYPDGITNTCYNCLDRHVAGGRGEQAALIYDSPITGAKRTISYAAMLSEVEAFAGALSDKGIGKGDRVVIYMPMVPEAIVAMLACARLGAVHSVVFGGFSSQAIAERAADCNASLIITADGGYRRGEVIQLKKTVDEALTLKSETNQEPLCANVKRVVVLKRAGNDVGMKTGRDLWWHDVIAAQSTECPAEEMDSEDPLFILYTSGSTGKPKGVFHTTAGYLLGTSMTHRYYFA